MGTVARSRRGRAEWNGTERAGLNSNQQRLIRIRIRTPNSPEIDLLEGDAGVDAAQGQPEAVEEVVPSALRVHLQS